MSSVEREDGQSGDVIGVQVALDHLGGDGRRLETKLLADAFFMFRLKMPKGAHGARELADAHLLGGEVEAGQAAHGLRMPIEQLEAKGRGFGVYSVGPPYGGRVLELERALLEDARQSQNAFTYEAGGFLDLQRLGGIDHVVRGEAIVEPARLRADLFGNRRGEGDDVVLDFSFDFLDAREREVSALADGLGRRLGYDAGLGQRFRGRRFDRQPHAVFIFIAPNAPHCGTGVTSNQGKPPKLTATHYSKGCYQPRVSRRRKGAS